VREIHAQPYPTLFDDANSSTRDNTLPRGRRTRPTQRGMLNTPTCPKKMPFFFLDLQMKVIFHKSFKNTMLIPANEKPEWILQFPG
jgi:hypothetical protein